MNSESELLVVFSDDWGAHPSSCQHLIGQLTEEVQILWVNTIGTRVPALDLFTLQRGWRKISRWLTPQSAAASTSPTSNPLVLDPLMWPSFRSRLGRAVNATMISRSVERAIGEFDRVVGVTTIPLTADLVGRLPVQRWIYYCVDDLSQWPGLDGKSLRAMERTLVTKVDSIIVVSDLLAERMTAMGRTSQLLTHGVDIEFWQGVHETVEALENYEKPLIVFWGVVDRRLDLRILEELDERLVSGTVLMLGPENQPEPQLRLLSKVRCLGSVPYAALPAVARSASVLIMPYADQEVTRAMQPLKLKEYLATGRPVVATDLPALGSWSDACDVVASPEEFARLVLERIDSGVPEDQLLPRRRLEQEAWSMKAQRFRGIVLGESSDEDAGQDR